MKTTQIPNIVSYVLGLFDTMVMLVAWPIGKKGCKGVDFTKIGLREMMDPAYRQKLAEGNIGVVQGEPSGRVGSFDIDGPGSEEFLTLNPDFKETLRTKGARGCNIWFYPEGDVPRSCRLKRNGQAWGEWRFNGCQTIIAGTHPSGVPYTILSAKKAIHYPFSKVKFPAGVTAKFLRSTDDVVTKNQPPTQTHSTEPLSVISKPPCPSVSLEAGNGLFEQQVLETLLIGTVPTGRHENHERLFLLARHVKALELGPGPLSAAHLRAVFAAWYGRAAAFLREDQTWDEYYYEFVEAIGDVKRPGDALVNVAWKAVGTANAPLPPEAALVVDVRLKKLVALCQLLQSLVGPQPFFLSCRTVQRLYGLPTHETGARWLRILCRAKIITEVTKGGPGTMKATRYRYQPLPPQSPALAQAA